MNDPAQIEFRLLEAANESWIPLWEVVWILRFAFPGQNDSDIVRTAPGVVSALVEKGFIYLAWLHDQDGESNEEVIPNEQVAAVLAIIANWLPAKTISEPFVVIATTPKGDERYELLLGSSRP